MGCKQVDIIQGLRIRDEGDGIELSNREKFAAAVLIGVPIIGSSWNGNAVKLTTEKCSVYIYDGKIHVAVLEKPSAPDDD